MDNVGWVLTTASSIGTTTTDSSGTNTLYQVSGDGQSTYAIDMSNVGTVLTPANGTLTSVDGTTYVYAANQPPITLEGMQQYVAQYTVPNENVTYMILSKEQYDIFAKLSQTLGFTWEGKDGDNEGLINASIRVAEKARLEKMEFYSKLSRLELEPIQDRDA